MTLITDLNNPFKWKAWSKWLYIKLERNYFSKHVSLCQMQKHVYAKSDHCNNLHPVYVKWDQFLPKILLLHDWKKAHPELP